MEGFKISRWAAVLLAAFGLTAASAVAQVGGNGRGDTGGEGATVTTQAPSPSPPVSGVPPKRNTGDFDAAALKYLARTVAAITDDFNGYRDRQSLYGLAIEVMDYLGFTQATVSRHAGAVAAQAAKLLASRPARPYDSQSITLTQVREWAERASGGDRPADDKPQPDSSSADGTGAAR